MSWYVAIVNPNCHKRARNALADMGYRAEWPALKKWCSHARRKVSKEYPILGRYIFVDMPDDNFWAVSNVNGIDSFVLGYDGAPAVIPADIVLEFRDRYMRGEWDYVTPNIGKFPDEQGNIVLRRNPIPVGAVVRIMEGEFANMLTVIRGRSKTGKLEFVPRGKREFYYTREGNVRAA